MTNINLKLKFYYLDFLKNKLEIFKVFSTIFISLLIFCSVVVLKNNMENEIKKSSKTLLGGDVEISSKNVSLNLEDIEYLSKNYLVSEIVEITSIVKTSKKNKTARIKIIDNKYPILGKENIEPPEALEILKKENNSILISEEIKNNLNLEIGDELRIQKIYFKVVGIIKSLPDIGSFFIFGDYVVIHKAKLKELIIDNLGSFVNYKYKLVSKNGKINNLDRFEKNENFSIKYPKDLGENLTKTLENFIFFLSIISVSTLLISGIGLQNSFFSFLSSNQKKIAIFKSLGLNSKNIKSLFLFQSFTILIISSFLAYILSLFLVSFFNPNLLNNLEIYLEPKFKINEFIFVFCFSITIFLIFTKPVLNVIDEVKISDLFRNSSTNLYLNYKKSTILKITFFLFLFVCFFCLTNVKPKQSIIFFIFFFTTGFYYYFLSKIQLNILDKVKKINNLILRIGIKNIQKFRNLTSIITITMGIGITVLLSISLISFNVNRELNDSIPRNAPDYFFLGLQENDLKNFSEIINDIDKEAKKKVVPMISARIETINNKDPRETLNKENDSFWFLNGERRISWTKIPPYNNPISKGEWWYSDQEKILNISIDEKVARDLKLKIGDSITFNIFGKKVSGIITNFRKVDYRNLSMNFAILFNPKFALKIPHEFMATVKFKEKNSTNLSFLLDQLPSLTYISLSEYVEKTRIFLNKLFTASMLISTIIVIIGLFVISNAINVLGKLKIYQNLIFRILGLSKFEIIKLIIFESILIFIPIFFSSLIISNVISYIFIEEFFEINWTFSFYILFLVSGLFFLILLLTILITNKKYLDFNLYTILKNH